MKQTPIPLTVAQFNARRAHAREQRKRRAEKYPVQGWASAVLARKQWVEVHPPGNRKQRRAEASLA